MDDLISRQAAIDALRDTRHRFTVADEAGGLGTVKWSEDVIYFAAAERVLSDLPSAEPKEVYCSMANRTCFANGKEVAWCLTCPHISEEDRELVRKAVEGSGQKTGKWIRHDEVINVYGGTCVECSECGEKYVVRHIEDEKYCRNCGADMRGEEE